MAITQNSFNSEIEQYFWIAKEVLKINQEKSLSLEKIAIIAPKHDTLEKIAEVFKNQEIPVFYEKRENVLNQTQIAQLTTMLKFVNSLSKQNYLEADELLPEILAYPCWQIPSSDLWLLSVMSYQKNSPQDRLWLKNMLSLEQKTEAEQTFIQAKKLKYIAEFFIYLAQKAQNSTVQEVLDLLVGPSKMSILADEENEEFEIVNPDETVENFDLSLEIFDQSLVLNQAKLQSPYKSFYFKDPESSQYLEMLSALRTFFEAIKNYKSNTTIYLSDLIEFLSLLQKNNLELLNNSSFGNSKMGVNLQTVHKSKGLEYDVVFVVNCQQSEWAAKSKGQKLGLPKNLQLLPEAEDLDDKLRLLYVALTRAKNDLYLTSFDNDSSGKVSEKLEFLEDNWQKISLPQKQVQEALEIFVLPKKVEVLSQVKLGILENLLENYQLSSTHLNNFIDIKKAGPEVFLETNLLRFPQAKNAFSSYGTAVHAAIAKFYNQFKETGILPKVSFLLEIFELILQTMRLSDLDFRHFLEQGREKLQIYYQSQQSVFDPNSILEFDFRTQGVVLDQARITGKIDKMDFDLQNKTIIVTDFKTGKALKSWQKGSDDEKIKALKYSQQLVFYKLLVENSREFGGKYQVNEAQLEFVEAPKNAIEIEILKKNITTEEAQKTTKLIQAVYQSIRSLNFPDTSKYPKNHQGVEEFVDDLVNSL